VRHGKAHQPGYSIEYNIDVLHQRRNLRKIWKDKLTNEEVLQRTGQRRRQDIVTERRFRFAPWIGHQRRAGEREEDPRRHGGQRSKKINNYT